MNTDFFSIKFWTFLANLIEFVSKSCNTGAKFLDAKDENSSHGGGDKRLVVDDVNFLGKHVDKEASAQHVWSYVKKKNKQKQQF